MTTTFRAGEMAANEFGEAPLAPPSAQPLQTAAITTRSKIFFTSDDGRLLAGTWECEPGASRWEFRERAEVVHVLSGRMTVQHDDEEPVELAAGSSAVFPLGWSGTWVVHETLRKVFTLYRPGG